MGGPPSTHAEVQWRYADLLPMAYGDMMFSLLFIISSCIWFVQVSLVATQGSPPYELTVERDNPSTRGSGVDLITLRCRGRVDDGIRFWLNRTRPNDPDLKDENYVFTSNDGTSITFQLRQEGFYTCGRQIDSANVEESERVPVISKLFLIR